MPRNKREGLVFGVAMAFTMSLFMNIFNAFRHSGISVEALGHALLLQPVIFTIVMIVENAVVSKAARKVMSGMVQKNDSASAKALAQTVCMVTGMSLAMSAIGLNTDLPSLVKNGARPLALGMVCWAAVAVTSLIVQHALGLL